MIVIAEPRCTVCDLPVANPDNVFCSDRCKFDYDEQREEEHVVFTSESSS